VRRLLAAASLLALAATPAAAPAQTQPGAPWPSMRHDARNTGASELVPRIDRRARPWSHRTGRGVFSTPVVGPDGTVYVGSADRVLHALGRDGRLRWQYRTAGLIDAAGVLGPGRTLTFGSGDELLRRLRTARGLTPAERRVWAFRPTLPAAPGQLVRWWEGNPQLGPDGTTYVGNTGGGAYAIDARGRQRWAVQRGNAVWTTPAVGPDGTTYWGSLDLAAFAVGPDGRERWSTGTGGYVVSSPALSADGRTVHVASFDGRLYALDAATGVTRWSFRTGDHVYSSPALQEDARGRLQGVVIASTDGAVYALDAGGRERWRFDTGEPVRSSPVLGRAPSGGGGRIVYVGGGDGRLYALDARTGRRRWSFDTTPRHPVLRDRNDLNASPALTPTGVAVAGEHGDVVHVPYDWCLRHRRDRRCDTRPEEPLPRTATRLVPVTPGGGLRLAGLRAPVPATAALPLRLLVRRAGRTVPARLLAVRATVSPAADPGRSAPAPMRAVLSGDGREVVLTPRGVLPPGARLAVRVTARTTEGRVRQAIHMRTAPAARRPVLGVPGGARPSAFSLGRLAVPLPAFLTSVNQIGFDDIDLLVGVLRMRPATRWARTRPGGPRRVLLWAIGARRDGRGGHVPDPRAGFAFPLEGVLRGDRLVARGRGASLALSFVTVPTRRFELRAQLTAGLRPRRSPGLVTETICGAVPVYGPLMRAIRLCNAGDVLVTSGTFTTAAYRGAAARRAPGTVVRRIAVRRPTATSAGEVAAVLGGRPLAARRHVLAVLPLDARTGRPAALDLPRLTRVTRDRGGLARRVTLRLPAGTPLPPRLRFEVLADLVPLPRARR
jgi:outer membrane protein assembly factor BamB